MLQLGVRKVWSGEMNFEVLLVFLIKSVIHIFFLGENFNYVEIIQLINVITCFN